MAGPHLQPMFAPVRYRFALYAHVKGPATSYRLLQQSLEPPLVALATCYDTDVRLYTTINEAPVRESDIDWTASQPSRYELHAVYSGSEVNRQLATKIMRAIEVFRSYYGLTWRNKRIETLLT